MAVQYPDPTLNGESLLLQHDAEGSGLTKATTLAAGITASVSASVTATMTTLVSATTGLTPISSNSTESGLAATVTATLSATVMATVTATLSQTEAPPSVAPSLREVAELCNASLAVSAGALAWDTAYFCAHLAAVGLMCAVFAASGLRNNAIVWIMAGCPVVMLWDVGVLVQNSGLGLLGATCALTEALSSFCGVTGSLLCVGLCADRYSAAAALGPSGAFSPQRLRACLAGAMVAGCWVAAWPVAERMTAGGGVGGPRGGARWEGAEEAGTGTDNATADAPPMLVLERLLAGCAARAKAWLCLWFCVACAVATVGLAGAAAYKVASVSRRNASRVFINLGAVSGAALAMWVTRAREAGDEARAAEAPVPCPVLSLGAASRYVTSGAALTILITHLVTLSAREPALSQSDVSGTGEPRATHLSDGSPQERTGLRRWSVSARAAAVRKWGPVRSSSFTWVSGRSASCRVGDSYV
nr:G protein coupled receptor [Eptesicus fuscus gammaherpesvirus]